ncbi:hypothetical protein E3T24_03820 [Cryobacterium sp. TmT2-59]|uniref:hypothetical protein n=1 Tax=Cryobacterium sp. TmT2-59 TaxID=1259264 RepID=UPI00106D35B8|nr:hypothetical protein [Cryobacterium sp. TmT2-59]TFC88083.1 hypothetical protein E3T24_03820 [Cryobacterium sp. TmT2-59]
MTGLPATPATPAADEDPAATLIVSGGGTTLVATDVLLAEASWLRALQADAEGWQARLAGIRALDSAPAPSPAWTGGEAAGCVFGVGRAIDRVAEHSRHLADSLIAAAEGYGEAERRSERVARAGGVWLGFTLGRLAPFLALAALPALTSGAAGFLLGSLLTGARPGDGPATAAGWLRANPRALTDPVVVAAVRVLVSSVDDAAVGAAGLPYPVSALLGDEGLGLLGVATSAAGVRALSRPLGLFQETPVSVVPVSVVPVPVVPVPVVPLGGPGVAGQRPATRATPPPAGFADLADRIPSVSEDGSQVRIERYGSAESPSWVVYIGGTVEWSPVAAEQPWDLTSDLSAVADQDSGSYRAVVQAMREAGVRPADPVIPVGHSQGGLVAAQVAASGEFNTVAVATFGAPDGQITLPPGVDAVTVEHSDDLIPALGGTPGAEDDRLLVRREVFAGREVPPDQPLPAHALTAYRATGRLMDESPEPRLQEFRATMATVVGAEPGQASRWRGIRVAGE